MRFVDAQIMKDRRTFHRGWLALLGVAGLLAACSPQEPAAASTTPSAPDGKAVFMRVCATCHQANGVGVPSVFPPLAGSSIVAGDPDRLIRIVLHGLQGPIEIDGKTFVGVMPAQGGQLDDAEIAAVLTYVRGAWGHRAAAVAPENVARIRAGTTRTTLWTWAELNAAGSP